MTISFRSRRLDGTWDTDSLQPFTFPAGEAHIKIADGFKLSDYNHFVADIREHNPQDLFHLAMWANVVDAEYEVDQGEAPRKTVLLPYIPGARADRGTPFGAEVYANFFNSLFLDQVICVDPHSLAVFKLYNSSEKRGGYNLVEFPFERIIRNEIQDRTSDTRPAIYDGVIAPDHGAVGRASRAAEVMGVPVYTAGKTRDFETGQLTGFHMEDELPKSGKFLIVDDICDGGGTFIGLSEAIAHTNPDVKLDLWVTHGVFSKGLREFPKYFGKIHTTNSFTNREKLFDQHINDHDIYDLMAEPQDGYWGVDIHDITPYLYGEIEK